MVPVSYFLPSIPGRVDEKATQLHAIASLKALLDAAKADATNTVTSNNQSKPVAPPQVPPSVQPSDVPLTTVDIEDQLNGDLPSAQVRTPYAYTFSNIM